MINNSFIDKLPDTILERIERAAAAKGIGTRQLLDETYEIRIAAYRDTLLVSSGGEISLEDKEYMGLDEVNRIWNSLINYSYYAYEDEIAMGYITLDGGHRVGICGSAVMEKGKVKYIKDITSLNIRHSREIVGASDGIMDYIHEKRGDLETVHNALIVSPPRCGKTTMLRDIGRQLSQRGYRIGICDERLEIGGAWDGSISSDLGARTDVLRGCPKAIGIPMLIRSMAPDVIITDELGAWEDVEIINQALRSGVKVITSIHSSSYEELAASKIRELISQKVFEVIVFLGKNPAPGTIKKIMRVSP